MFNKEREELIFDVHWKQHNIGKIFKNSSGHFVYRINSEGLESAKQNGYHGLFGYEELNGKTSKEFFPIFADRLPGKGRADIGEILEKYGLDEYNTVKLLAKTRGRLFTDNISLEER